MKIRTIQDLGTMETIEVKQGIKGLPTPEQIKQHEQSQTVRGLPTAETLTEAEIIRLELSKAVRGLPR